MLNSLQIESYRKDGYLVLEDVLEPEQLATLRAITEEFIERSRLHTHSDDVFDLDPAHSAGNPRLSRIKLPHKQHPAFWKIVRSERVCSVLTSLLGADVRLHNSKLNTKPPGGGAAVEWHQDWAFYPHTNDDLLAVGIMLDDVTLDNGPLMVIPGSHCGEVLQHTANGVFSGAIDPHDPAFDVDRAVALTGRAGSMSVHHVRTLHGSAPNLSDRPRMLLFYECGAADAWPINGNASSYTGLNQQDFWDALQERMICGEQSLSPRLEKVPVLMPLPPAPDCSSIFRIQQSSGARSAFV
ncbi:MAG: phytanoyl-CoA dioxygenase family protein [Granulosicoccus sp.]|nr:phytanoyl-CoA dioxygenase family protein [Granulosicoccus sp.]